jgi:hypothetical protein
MKKEEVQEVRIEMTIDSLSALFIVLSKEGTIARQGSGTKEISNIRYLGQSEGQYFNEVMKHVNEEIFEHFGVYDMPEKDGEQCRLSVVFKDDKSVNGFEFYFGFKSKHGPHIQIASLVENAIKITEPWFRGAMKKGAKKKRWKLF